MLLPDVTGILVDPEIGGGQSFQVKRRTSTRTLGDISVSTETFNLIGNIQPQDMNSQTSTTEGIMDESIVIYCAFSFSVGKNDGGSSFTEADDVLYDGNVYRVTRVNNWSKWGFSIAYATRVRTVPAEGGTE